MKTVKVVNRAVFGLRDFFAQYRPEVHQLLYALAVRVDAKWMRDFEYYAICVALEENFLLTVVGHHRRHPEFEPLLREVRNSIPGFERDLRHQFHSFVGVHAMPDIISVQFNGIDVVVRNLE